MTDTFRTVDVERVGAVVPIDDDVLLDAIALRSVWARLFRPLTWEERLAAEIERRSIRGRLRRARYEATGRLQLAWDALLGRHECDY